MRHSASMSYEDACLRSNPDHSEKKKLLSFRFYFEAVTAACLRDTSFTDHDDQNWVWALPVDERRLKKDYVQQTRPSESWYL